VERRTGYFTFKRRAVLLYCVSVVLARTHHRCLCTSALGSTASQSHPGSEEDQATGFCLLPGPLHSSMTKLDCVPARACYQSQARNREPPAARRPWAELAQCHNYCSRWLCWHRTDEKRWMLCSRDQMWGIHWAVPIAQLVNDVLETMDLHVKRRIGNSADGASNMQGVTPRPSGSFCVRRLFPVVLSLAHLVSSFRLRPPVWLQAPPSLFPPVPRSLVYLGCVNPWFCPVCQVKTLFWNPDTAS